MIGSRRALLQAAAGNVREGWDLANASFPTPYGVFDTSPQNSSIAGIFFKPDGTKMYFVSGGGDAVYEYDLSTAWQIFSASFVQSFSVATQETAPFGIFFKSDGTKMYICGSSGDDVNEYNLSAAWNISTASYFQSFSVAAQDISPRGIFFKPDGLKMYVVGAASDDINEYNLSVAWDVSTASFVQVFSIAAEESNPYQVFFKPDGLKMYVVGPTGDDVNEYNLSTAWNISTASFVQSFSVAVQSTAPGGFFFKPDGTTFYVTQASIGKIYSYTLASAWNVSTATWDSPTANYFSIQAQVPGAYGTFFRADGTKMYITSFTNDNVTEYSLGTAWDISTASFVQSLSVSAQDSIPAGIFFKPDGLKMYVVGGTGDDVNEYDLSSAWDISTASYLQNFSVVAQDITPLGIFFKPDGLKMYVVGNAGDAVYEYDLSTAWNISTASFVQSFSVAAQDTSPNGLFFKPDGFKMYVAGGIDDEILQYDLSTAWNISTASFVQGFSVAAQGIDPFSVSFKPDGTQMFVGITGVSTGAMWAYAL